ncbi:DUF4363 family protein [Desulfosporosinus metallidurans]|uniref:DUF4363 family protein n=1 Tax=Desulfosporosinus metallidurans TaxID=1888891 RepID=A0A1Q8QX61_9FIRM|nr:DUF4363 family protein [Desulfosporosinus metallidurans]OLN31921.1 hypothetical protein DSOL_2216 [Desulfosporosinus metallidurans]
MRTLTTIFVIVFLLAGGSFISHGYIQTTTHALVTQLETVEHSISTQNWKVAQTELNTTHRRWDINKTLWTILLHHQEIDTIDLSMERLEKYMATQDSPLSLGEVSTLKLLFAHIADSDQLNLKNIL